MTSDYRDADPAGSDELSIETEAFGPEQAAIDRVRDALEERQEVRDRLQGTEHRLLAFELVEPPRKLEKPQPPDAYRATYYDYTNNRSVAVEGRFADQEHLTVTESAAQPLPTAEEFGAAVEILAQDPVFRSAVHEHLVQPYPAMPPVIEA
jgi:hypothetical protein